MTSGSIGSHRAFMGVCITLCVCLLLTLYVGWSLYATSRSDLNSALEMDQKAEKRAQDLQNLGLSFAAVQAEAAPPSVLPKLLASGGEVPQAPSLSPPVLTHTPVSVPAQASVPAEASAPSSSAEGALYPAESKIHKQPLMESSEEVVQALALLEQYWKTEVWQERVPLVANSEQVAAKMKDYYETQGGTDPKPGDLISKARYKIDETEFLYLNYSSSRPMGSLEVVMLRDPQGKFLVDWESLTGYGEMSFQDFRSQRPTQPVLMRTYVRLFDYYNFEFTDAQKYLCIKLISENGENSIYAYCERGTPLADALARDLASTGPSVFKGYTLLLSFPPDAESNQCVKLDKVVALRWLNVP